MNLKPCPFCGGEAVYHRCAELENETMNAIYRGYIGVHCNSCGVASQPYPSMELAREAWNKRVKDKPHK